MPAKKNSLKTAAGSKHIVVDDDGTEYTVHGYGWAKPQPLDIDPRIDLTEPIWEQVQRLERSDKRAGRKQRSTAAA